MGRQAFRRRKSDGTLDDGTGGGANNSVFPLFSDKISSNVKYYPVGYEFVVSETGRTFTPPTNEHRLFGFRADYSGTVTHASITTHGGTAADPSSVIVTWYDTDSNDKPKDRIGYHTYDTSGATAVTTFNEALDSTFTTVSGETYWVAFHCADSTVGLFGYDRCPMRISQSASPLFYYKFLRHIGNTGAIGPSALGSTIYAGNLMSQPNMTFTYSGL